MRKKEEELEDEKQARAKAEAELNDIQARLAEKDAYITVLEAQVEELTPFKAEAERLRADKAAAELAAKQQELTAFAEGQGLDLKDAAVVEAIQKVDYEALIA